ncbi:hypothetical protein [Pseudoruegeria sp. SHC-113]|uniref:hypothetical protein n=1 Tax=Pseudoruegeria sp. SHC-113 TaxID=2855439 RepID=UPI0021BADD04|nr:hypothetical protein [Pseudoruegeria sp. SHC-113]MCT8159799.1 hypothetical protein [Pseudoruegeria sp. SHC-113]
MAAAPQALLAVEGRSAELLELIRANGCKMSATEADEILPKHGYTMDETRDIVREWSAEGLIKLRDFQGIELSEKGCNG